MKKQTLAAVLTTALVAVSCQETQAWFKLGINASFRTTLSTGGHHLQWRSESCPCPPACGPAGCYPGYGAYGMMGQYPYGAAQPGAAQGQTQPNAAQPNAAQPNPNQLAAYYASMYQTVAYYPQMASYYPPAYGGYYQAPSYWYGR